MRQKLIINRLLSVLFCLESCVCCLWSVNGPSTNVEDSLQINLFLQNKPNVKYAKMNIRPFMTIKYVKLDTWLSGKNKPNQSQSNPIQSQFAKTPKMNLNIYPTMVYSNKSAIRRKQNKPNQTQFQTQFTKGQNELKIACRKIRPHPKKLRFRIKLDFFNNDIRILGRKTKISN
jgi:hypothetical protein